MGLLDRGTLKGVWKNENGRTVYGDFSKKGNFVPRLLPKVDPKFKRYLKFYDIPFLEDKNGDVFLYDPNNYHTEKVQSEVWAKGYDGNWGVLNPKYTGDAPTKESIKAAAAVYSKFLEHRDEFIKHLTCVEALSNGKKGNIICNSLFKDCDSEIFESFGDRFGIYKVRCSDDYGMSTYFRDSPIDVIIIDMNKVENGKIDVVVPAFIKNMGRLVGTCGWQTELFKEKLGVEPNFIRLK